MSFGLYIDVVADERAAGTARQVDSGARSQNAAHHAGRRNGLRVREIPQHVPGIGVVFAGVSILIIASTQFHLCGDGHVSTVAVDVDHKRGAAVERQALDGDGVAILRKLGQRQIQVGAALALRVRDGLFVLVGEINLRAVGAARGELLRQLGDLRLHLIHVDERRAQRVEILRYRARERDLAAARHLRVLELNGLMPVVLIGVQIERIGVVTEHDNLVGQRLLTEAVVLRLVVLDVAERGMPVNALELGLHAVILNVGHMVGQDVAVDMDFRVQRIESHQVKATGNSERVARSVFTLVAVVVPLTRREPVGRIDGGEVHIAVVPVRAGRQLARSLRGGIVGFALPGGNVGVTLHDRDVGTPLRKIVLVGSGVSRLRQRRQAHHQYDGQSDRPRLARKAARTGGQMAKTLLRALLFDGRFVWILDPIHAR